MNKDQVMINGIEYVPKVIAPEPVKVGRWKPDRGEEYWHLTTEALPNRVNWNNYYPWHEKRYACGNVYQTESLATLARDKQLLLVELQDFADRANEGKDTRQSYTLHYYAEWKCIILSFVIPGLIEFKESDSVASAITHFGDRLNLLKPTI